MLLIQMVKKLVCKSFQTDFYMEPDGIFLSGFFMRRDPYMSKSCSICTNISTVIIHWLQEQKSSTFQEKKS